jgi:parallel beta-helix repeat protein
VLSPATAASAAGIEIAAAVPALAVEIPLPPELPVVGTEITDFLRFNVARRHTWRPLLLVVLLVAVAVGAGMWVAVGHAEAKVKPVRVAVTASTAGTVVWITRGPVDLSQLERSLTLSGHGSLISSVPGGAVEVNANIVVGTRGILTITRSALLLRSDALTHVRLLAQGGELNLDDDTVTSWTSEGAVDEDPLGGRADIVATGRGAELNFTNCQVIGLGTDTDDPGVSWTEGASGTVQNSQFSDNWRAAYADESGALNIVNSSFTRSQEDGVLMLDPGRGSTIQNSTFANNARSGLEIAGTARNLNLVDDTADNNGDVGLLTRLTAGDVNSNGGLFYDNLQSGISADGGRLSLNGAKVWANETGVALNGGADSVTGSDLSANTQYGMFVTGAGTAVTAGNDRFDHNSLSGLWVSNGRIVVTGGLFDENLTGINLAGSSDSFRATGNTITNSVKDGIALDVAPGIQIEGNVIENNGDSAISTNKAYNLRPVLAQNTIANNQTATRIRASD